MSFFTPHFLGKASAKINHLFHSAKSLRNFFETFFQNLRFGIV